MISHVLELDQFILSQSVCCAVKILQLFRTKLGSLQMKVFSNFSRIQIILFNVQKQYEIVAIYLFSISLQFEITELQNFDKCSTLI